MITLLLSLIFSVHADTLVMYPGYNLSVAAPPGQKIVLEKKGLVSLKDQGRKVQIVGKKTGNTHLQIGNKDYDLQILKEGAFKTYQKLILWREGKMGPSIQIDHGQIYIRGRIYSFIDWQELGEQLGSHDEFSIQAEVDSEIQAKIKNYLKELSNKNNIPFGVFNLDPEWEISLNSTEKKNAASYKKIFSPLGVQVTESTHALSAVPMIEVNILAAEVKRSELTRFGVNWQEATSLQIVPKFGLNPESVFVSVDHFEQQGWGKVLASPTLLAQSGEEATFHSGGEFPIKTSNQFNAGVNWKKYGIILKIKPRADFNGKMSINIECEISMIDDSATVDGVPGLLMNRMSSHFNLTETKTIALSGLLKEEWGESQRGLPGFKNIPIFSQLFSSKQYRNNQTELMFFVTPRIIKQ